MKKTILKRLIIENLVKNFLIVIISFLYLNVIREKLSSVNNSQMNDFLLILSILIVAVCFANFAFSYKYSDLTLASVRILSHATVFILMLLLAFTLTTLSLSVDMVYPNLFSIVTTFSILLYVGVVLYDFWDLLRYLNKSR